MLQREVGIPRAKSASQPLVGSQLPRSNSFIANVRQHSNTVFRGVSSVLTRPVTELAQLRLVYSRGQFYTSVPIDRELQDLPFDSAQVSQWVEAQLLERLTSKWGLASGWARKQGIAAAIEGTNFGGGDIDRPSLQRFADLGGEFRLVFRDVMTNKEVLPLKVGMASSGGRSNTINSATGNVINPSISNRVNSDPSIRLVQSATVLPNFLSHSAHSGNQSFSFDSRARPPWEEGVMPVMQHWWVNKRFSKTYFISHHYWYVYFAYILLLISLGAAVIWGVGEDDLHFLDALYISTSAVTMTGLCSVDFTKVGNPVQVATFLLVLFGGPMLITLVPVIIRRRSFRFQRRFAERQGKVFTGDEIEFKALDCIQSLVFQYWLGCHLLSWLSLWLILGSYDEVEGSAWWNALFITASSFQNAGFCTLVKGLMIYKNGQGGLLFPIMFCILAGNSFYPILLRFMVLIRLKLCANLQDREALQLLLDNPRKCYTHLFPNYATRWIAVVSIALLLLQIFMLCSLDWRFPIMKGLSPEDKALASVFHAISTRTAGMNVLDLSKLSTASAFLLSVCMWISTSPVVVTMRYTSVQDRIVPEYDLAGAHTQSVTDHKSVQRQLGNFMTAHAFPLVILLLAILSFEQIQGIYHDKHHHHAKRAFLRCVFEFASAYGTVGLSMSDEAWSFSGDWSRAAQFCLMAVMIMGRLRGLPESIDPSVAFSYSETRFQERQGSQDLLPSRLEENSEGSEIGNGGNSPLIGMLPDSRGMSQSHLEGSFSRHPSNIELENISQRDSQANVNAL